MRDRERERVSEKDREGEKVHFWYCLSLEPPADCLLDILWVARTKKKRTAPLPASTGLTTPNKYNNDNHRDRTVASGLWSLCYIPAVVPEAERRAPHRRRLAVTKHKNILQKGTLFSDRNEFLFVPRVVKTYFPFLNISLDCCAWEV